MTKSVGGGPHDPPRDAVSGPSPRNLESEVGAEIRRLRQHQDMRVGELASAAGISQGMLSKIENGQTQPSLTTLSALADALAVPLSALFVGLDRARDVSYVPAGAGIQIDRRGTRAGHLYRLLGHGVRGPLALEPYLITLDEGSEPFTGFRHDGTEFLHILEGELVYRHGDQRFHLKPGDSLLFDAGALHGPEELLVFPVRFLSVIAYPGQR